MKIKRHRSAACAFTLIEVLTVIAIIAILSAILIHAVSASRERGHIAYCANNLGQIGKALMGSMAVHYLEKNKVANGELWTLHTQ